jgi:hypothetical protein
MADAEESERWLVKLQLLAEVARARCQGLEGARRLLEEE